MSNECWRGCGKREPSYTFVRNVCWCSHYGKQDGGPPKNLKIELPYDAGIPLLGLYIEENIIRKDNVQSFVRVSTIHSNQLMDTI